MPKLRQPESGSLRRGEKSWKRGSSYCVVNCFIRNMKGNMYFE